MGAYINKTHVQLRLTTTIATKSIGLYRVAYVEEAIEVILLSQWIFSIMIVDNWEAQQMASIKSDAVDFLYYLIDVGEWANDNVGDHYALDHEGPWRKRFAKHEKALAEKASPLKCEGCQRKRHSRL